MAVLKTKNGILALIDVVNFTGQANNLGDRLTADFTGYFQEKIKILTAKHNFKIVKFLGDAVLVFGTSLEGILEIMIDLFHRDKLEDKYGFVSRFRMVAHTGYFQFQMEGDEPVDLVSAPSPMNPWKNPRGTSPAGLKNTGRTTKTIGFCTASGNGKLPARLKRSM